MYINCKRMYIFADEYNTVNYFFCMYNIHAMMTNYFWFVGSFLPADMHYILDAATSPGILKAKQKLGRTFNSDKLL